MLDLLAFIESPVQIGFVLVLALLLFGPKRLPEIGRQVGSALRELRKAASEVGRAFNTDYEPDGPNYSYPEPSGDYGRYGSYYTQPAEVEPVTDLTDYTLSAALAARIGMPTDHAAEVGGDGTETVPGAPPGASSDADLGAYAELASLQHGASA